jgi:hypothetical protein
MECKEVEHAGQCLNSVDYIDPCDEFEVILLPSIGEALDIPQTTPQPRQPFTSCLTQYISGRCPNTMPPRSGTSRLEIYNTNSRNSHLTTERRVATDDSLQGLVELTAYPVLPPCMESISLGTYRVNNHHERHILNIKEAAYMAGSFRIRYNFRKERTQPACSERALLNLKHRSIRSCAQLSPLLRFSL